MKFFVLVLSGLVSSCSIAQQFLEFDVQLDGDFAIPPTTIHFHDVGSFTLNDENRFRGVLEFLGYNRFISFTSVQIFETFEASVLGLPRFDLTYAGGVPPSGTDDGADLYLFDAIITDEDRLSLLAGNWWINVSTIQNPVSEVRGQIVVVPEPSTIALLVLGATVVALRRRKT